MREINKIAESLFEKIRDRFEDVSLGDENAKATSNPEDARFFNFDYVVDGENHGNITMSIIDEISLKVYFSKNLSSKLDDPHKQDWYNFLRELREFARRNLLSFEPRDITRSTLKHRDIQQVSKADNTYSKDEVVKESRMYGTLRRSYESFGPVRIKIAHSKPIVDETKGGRSRNIEAIYVENDQGERFRMPFNSIVGARAMARHVSAGGVPTDEIGQHITGIVNEMLVLRPFVHSMRHRTFEDVETKDMLESAFEYHGLLKNTLKKLKGKKGYTEFKENFKPMVVETEVDVDSIREKFVKKVFPDKLAEALPIVQKAYEMKKADNNPLLKTFEDWAETVSEGVWAVPDDENKQRELQELLAEPLMLGVDAANATNALYNLIGDDTLYDELSIAAEQDPEADARSMVVDWLVAHGYENLVPAEMQDNDVTGAGMSGQNGTVYESQDSFEAVQAAIIRRIIHQHVDVVREFGPDAIAAAVEDEASFVGDVDEIGTSDVSAWTNSVIRALKSGQYSTRLREGVEDAGSAVAKIIAELIGDGHTEVSPDVITTKVSAALGRPFMLKDLVAANNSSPQLQRYISSINPTKIKFSTDILTVKNENPAKEKAQSQAAVSSMAERAANRKRLGESKKNLNELSPQRRDDYSHAAQKDMAKHAAAAKVRRNVYGVDDPEAEEHEKEAKLRARGLERAQKRHMSEQSHDAKWVDAVERHERLRAMAKRQGDENKFNFHQAALNKLYGKESPETPGSTFNDDPGGIKVDESLRPGEYHLWTVHFDDGTSEKVPVSYDETSTQELQSRFKDKKIVKVDRDFAIHSSGMPGTERIPYDSPAAAYHGVGAYSNADVARNIDNPMVKEMTNKKLRGTTGKMIENFAAELRSIIDEGAFKEIDIEHQDYKKMSHQQFQAAYGMSKREWWAKNGHWFSKPHNEDAADDVEQAKKSKAKIEKPAYLRKQQGGDWKAGHGDIEAAKDIHKREFELRKQQSGLEESLQDIKRLAGL